MVSIKEKLMEILKGKLDNSILSELPSRYPMLGEAILLRLKPRSMSYASLIGNAILNIVSKAKSVWVFVGKTYGVIRRPQIVCVAGDCNPIVTHKELKTTFRIDISRLTFSPGNSGERARLVEIMDKQDVIVDFFACCGNLSLPIATNKKPKKIYALEINSLAYSYLLENIRINRVSHIVQPFLMDNHYWNIFEIADHVLLGFLPAPDRIQFELALKTISAEGGIVHYHCVIRKEILTDEIRRLEKLANKVGYRVIKLEYQRVKGVAPKLDHFVIRLHVMIKENAC